MALACKPTLEDLTNAITLFRPQLAKEIALQTYGCDGELKLATRTNNPECLLPGGEGQELSCCVRGILSSQADLRTTRSQIEEIIEEASHLVIPYPKFHL
jgi:hypothetical protein